MTSSIVIKFERYNIFFLNYKMDYGKIFSCCVIHNICQYLDYRDLMRWRQTNKFFCAKIEKMNKYRLVGELEQFIQTKNIRSIVSKKLKQYGEMSLAERIIRLVVSSPWLAVILAPFSLWMILDKLILKYEYYIKSKNYRNIIKLYQASLTDEKYFEITDFLVSMHPEIITHIPDTDDLTICITHQNSKTGSFLIQKLSSIYSYDGLKYFYEDIRDKCHLCQCPDIVSSIQSTYNH